jgi:hypothetical protein
MVRQCWIVNCKECGRKLEQNSPISNVIKKCIQQFLSWNRGQTDEHVHIAKLRRTLLCLTATGTKSIPKKWKLSNILQWNFLQIKRRLMLKRFIDMNVPWFKHWRFFRVKRTLTWPSFSQQAVSCHHDTYVGAAAISLPLGYKPSLMSARNITRTNTSNLIQYSCYFIRRVLAPLSHLRSVLIIPYTCCVPGDRVRRIGRTNFLVVGRRLVE